MEILNRPQLNHPIVYLIRYVFFLSDIGFWAGDMETVGQEIRLRCGKTEFYFRAKLSVTNRFVRSLFLPKNYNGVYATGCKQYDAG